VPRLEALPEPANLQRVKDEVIRRCVVMRHHPDAIADT
jgi:hypothetical protein